jgi:hypothetical protein
MRRVGALAVAAVMSIVLGQLVVAAQPPQNILVARNADLAIIDANDNGALGDEDDCILNATVRSDGSNLVIRGTQGWGPNSLLVCSGKCYGSAYLGSTSGEVEIRACDYSHPPFVPLLADFCPNLAQCLENDNNSSLATGGTAGVPPTLVVTAGTIMREMTEVNAGSGRVCSAGGPAVEITGDDGVTVLRELVPFPDGNHMCVRNVPFELVQGGFVFRTACFPVEDGKAEFSLSDEPEQVLVLIDFDRLPPCALRGAPTMSEWGLIVLVAALLGFGTWALSRRRSFYAMRLP